MTGDAERIRTLRQRVGKSADEIALLAGLGDMAYFDLESYDDELRTVLSLTQVKRLADAFGVPAAALFSDDVAKSEHRVSYDELVALVKGHVDSGVSREAIEEEIGWDLGAFFESEEIAFSEYGVEFLQALCTRLRIDWIAALP